MRTFPRLLVVPAIAVLVLVPAACSSGSSGRVAEPVGTVVGFAPTPAREVGRRSLPDVSTDPAGTPFAFRAPPGGLLVVYFGYLSCPDICPVTMVDTAAGIAELPEDLAERIEVAFVTVDIERDTGPRLNDYLTHFFPSTVTHSLRAVDSNQLTGVTSEFGVQWQVDPHEPGATTYGVAHSGSTSIVDDRGRLIWSWPFGSSAPDVAATLAQLLEATATPS